MSKAATETFLLQIRSGKIESDKAKIYNFIRRNERTTKQYIEKELRMPHQTVTARLSDLQDLGVITVVGRDNTLYNVLSQYVIENDPVKIESNRLERSLLKFIKWKKKCKEFQEHLSNQVITELSA